MWSRREKTGIVALELTTEHSSYLKQEGVWSGVRKMEKEPGSGVWHDAIIY